MHKSAEPEANKISHENLRRQLGIELVDAAILAQKGFVAALGAGCPRFVKAGEHVPQVPPQPSLPHDLPSQSVSHPPFTTQV